jgi:hypothetical protein
MQSRAEYCILGAGGEAEQTVLLLGRHSEHAAAFGLFANAGLGVLPYQHTGSGSSPRTSFAGRLRGWLHVTRPRVSETKSEVHQASRAAQLEKPGVHLRFYSWPGPAPGGPAWEFYDCGA